MTMAGSSILYGGVLDGFAWRRSAVVLWPRRGGEVMFWMDEMEIARWEGKEGRGLE